MHQMTVPAGATIFKTGDPSEAVYIIEDGEIAIFVGNGLEVARLHAGELFGESGVLEARPRSATAVATAATKLLVTEGDAFFKAFGMDNDRALSLVKLLCARLRTTTQRNAATTPFTPGPEGSQAPIRLMPGIERLVTEYGMQAMDVQHLPFQVGNRFGGEASPIASNRSCCIPARGDAELAAPHFEILKRDGKVGVRDMGTHNGTIVNGTVITRTSMNSFVPLRAGDNDVIAGRQGAPFQFRIYVRGA
jgi:CRP-like cAMP-binding protein